jgi:WD40 repeat protein
MRKLNNIKTKFNKNLELIAMGNSSGKIIIFNIVKFNIYQVIAEHKRSVYSLEQYKNDPNYLFSSSEEGVINIYKLNNDYKYKLIQKLQKENGEINKVIALSNKLLVSGDNKSITIWKLKNKNGNNIEYEELKEILIERDICHLLEVNSSVFVATQYSGGYFQVYKNDNESFQKIGELENISTHGYSSNGLGKINDNIVISGGKNWISIISIEPLQEIQKIYTEDYGDILYVSINRVNGKNYIYIKKNSSLTQFKIINDEDNNFVELIQLYKTSNYSLTQKAIIPFDDGRLFFCERKSFQILLHLAA